MDAERIATFCAVRELTFVEAGLADGSKGGWFQDRKRHRSFVTEQEITDFTERVRQESARRVQVYASYTS
jgi:hypothetical protein